MGVKGVLFQLDHRHRDVAAVVADALEIRDQVVEHKAVLQRADALLQAVDMAVLHLVAQIVDQLLQRLDHAGALQVPIRQRADGEVQHLPDSPLHDVQLVDGVGAELDGLVVDLLRVLRDVRRMVRNPFKVRDRVQELVQILVLPLGQLDRADLDKIAADPVLIVVDGLLQLLNLPEALLAVFMQQAQCPVEVSLYIGRHGKDDDAALFDGDGRMAEKALVQQVPVPRGVVRPLLGLVRDDPAGKLPQQVDGRGQDRHGHDAEDGVERRHAHRRHGRTHKGDRVQGVDGIENNAAEQSPQDVDDQIDQGRSPGVQRGALRAQQDRNGPADGDAEDHGKGLGKGEPARHAQGLQQADRPRRGLDQRGEDNAGRKPQQRVCKAVQQGLKLRVVPQGHHRRAHGVHAEQQDRQTQQDRADVVAQRLLAEFEEQDAHDRQRPREEGRRENHRDAFARGKRCETCDPAGDAGADNGAQDDADRLAELHQAGVDKADDHDAGRRGRLHQRRDADAEKDALDRVSGHLI